MLPGLAGHLVSERCLEQQLASAVLPIDRSPWHADLARWRECLATLGPASSLRALLDGAARPLVQLLGFSPINNVRVDDSVAVASFRTDGCLVTLLVVPWGARLDSFWRRAVVESVGRGAAWSMLFNGTHIRVIQTSRVHSRRFAEVDLDFAADDERTALAMRALFGAEHLKSSGRSRSALAALIEESDRDGAAVCRSLGQGVLDASAAVLQALVNRRPVPDLGEAFDQALTIVYRMLFLFFAEARALVPLWHPVYRRSYSMEALRDQALQRSSIGMWETVRALTRLAHAGCRAGDLRVTAFNGRLFAPARTPLADRRDLDDEAARRSVVALATRRAPDGEGREPITYRDLGVEQLGAVYETLLDYTPVLAPASDRVRSRAPAVVTLRSGSGVRKSTGTFYTPVPIVSYLVRRTLGPLVRERAPDAILRLRVLDPSMGSGAFLVGACTYLADAYESALVDTGRCRPGDLGPGDRASIRRTVAERCLYGVDLNPTAVQLARLSLWLATLAADRPLSFLDHHLQTGDSLIGAWLSNLHQAPPVRRTRREPGPLVALFDVHETMREVLPVRVGLANGPNDTAHQVHAKERVLARLAAPGGPLAGWKRVADLWCARWFSRELQDVGAAFTVLADTVTKGRAVLPASSTAPLLAAAAAAAAERRFFHWELEFPEVFFDDDGRRSPAAGFDAVIGNPPWDMVRADRAASDPEGHARSSDSAGVRFTRESGIYHAQGEGHANRYQMFVERALALVRPGGRVGLVVPAGLATDRGSAPLRRHLFARCQVDALVGFDNRRAIFPIHRSVRFLLLSGTVGNITTSFGCRLGETDPSVLDDADEAGDDREWFPVHVSRPLLQALSGDALSVPDLRTPMDVAIAERAATCFAPLGDASGWGACFGRELNATSDRPAFGPPGRGLPLVEGKLIAPFRVDVAAARASISAARAERRLGSRFRRARLAYRDVASPTNRLTLIAAMLPAGCVSTHTVFCLKGALPARAQWFLCGLFNSFVVNYLVRLRVSTHVSTGIVERLPIPTAADAHTAFDDIAALARLLSRRHDGASAARLHAQVARLYRLTDAEFAHVLGTFPLVPELDRASALHVFRRAL